MTTNDPAGTVQRMFAAFRVGDIDAVLDTANADTHWTYIGANPKPSKADLVGKEGVRRFFEAMVKRLDVTTFEANEFVLEGDTRRRIRRGIGNRESHWRAVPQRVVSQVCGQGEPDYTHGRVQRSGGAAMMSASGLHREGGVIVLTDSVAPALAIEPFVSMETECGAPVPA